MRRLLLLCCLLSFLATGVLGCGRSQKEGDRPPPRAPRLPKPPGVDEASDQQQS
jgi:hypothetical protein